VGNQERIDALRRCAAEYRASLQHLNTAILEAPADQRGPLRQQRNALEKKLEQTEIEIDFLTDRRALRERCERLRDAALRDALREPEGPRRQAIEDRADFYEIVIDEVLTKTQTVFPIDEASLRPILAALNEAAREAKNTVDSINRSISIANRVLDGLLLLVRTAARLAVMA
jgi:hypothetical protein